MCFFNTGRSQQNATTEAVWASRWHQVAMSVSGGAVDVHVDGELLVSTPVLDTSRASMLQPGDVISVHGGYRLLNTYYILNEISLESIV